MLLRRFYIQENEKGLMRVPIFARRGENLVLILIAPKPRPKKNRELNTKFDDVETARCDTDRVSNIPRRQT